MKRIRLWLKELSLSQQLLTIIFLVVTIFVIFFSVYLMGSIDKFVESQMYKLLDDANEETAVYLEKNIDLQEYNLGFETNVMHLICTNGECVTTNGTKVAEEVLANIQTNLSNQEVIKHYSFQEDERQVLYTISNLSDGRQLVSLLTDSYRSDFRNALVNSVINLNILVVGMMFVFLMIWIGTLIHPLNQIKNYVNKIRNDEDATLKIDRRDEIGQLADALVEMEEEISHQHIIREEMIQNISHDLKTPIATIKSYGESIKDGIYPYETLEKSVDVIIEHATRLENKVHSLIMYNKMGYLLDADEDVATNMKEIIEKVILSLKVVKPEIQLTTNLQEVYFHGENEPWRIVVENLIENGLRYAQTHITVELRDDELRVSNDGILLTSDQIAKIFRPYEIGTNGKFGLGLSIVSKVCSTYGYHVQAENLSDGVVFIVTKVKNKQKNKKRGTL